MTEELTGPDRRAPGASSEPATTTTRVLLACGAIAGPLFTVVALLQMAARDGFDPTRHAISLLSNGDLGWIQITNFVLAGLLFLAGAVGLRRVLHPGTGGTWGARLIGAMGSPWSGVGCSSPTRADGFPPGTTRTPRPAQLAQHPAYPRPGGGAPLAHRGVFRIRSPLPPHRATGLGGLLHSDRRGGPDHRRHRVFHRRLPVLFAGAVLLWGWASVMAAQLLTGRPDATGELR